MPEEPLVRLSPVRKKGLKGKADRFQINKLYWDEHKKGTIGHVLPPLWKAEFREGNYFFIKVNGKLAGAVALLKFPSVRMKFNDKPHVMRLLLKSEFRGKRITPRVMDAIEQESRKRGYDEIYTRVHPTNTKMLENLEKNGWEKVAEDQVSSREVFRHELFTETKKLWKNRSEKGKSPQEIIYRDVILKKKI